MSSFSSHLNLFLENLFFLVIATFFFGLVGWIWRGSKPFSIPKPLPSWFRVWLFTVLIVGVFLPFLAMLLWGAAWGHSKVLTALIPYFLILGIQILSESITLNQFHSCVWVTIPCVYLPYRIWQLYRGLILLNTDPQLMWVENLLWVEIVLWIFNYGVHLSQLPRLLRWDVLETTSADG